MAYDEELADRVRAALAADGPADEQRMFGGLAFLLGGHMTVCVTGHGGLMVRVPAEEREALLAHDGAEPMVMSGRASRTWLHVLPPGITSDADLAAWVGRGVAVVRGLPPKGQDGP